MKDIKIKPTEGSKSTSTKAGVMPKQAIKMLAEQAKEKAVTQGREQLAPKEREGDNSPSATASGQMAAGIGMAVTVTGQIAYTGGRKLAQKTAEKIKQRRENDIPIKDQVSAESTPAATSEQPAGKQDTHLPVRERTPADTAQPIDMGKTGQKNTAKQQSKSRIKTKESTVSQPRQKPRSAGRETPCTIKTPQPPATATTPGTPPTVTAAVRRKQVAAVRPAALQLVREKAATTANAGRKALEALKRVLANLRAALQSLTTAITAAAALAAALVLIISLVAFIAGSAYGIFLQPSRPTMASRCRMPSPSSMTNTVTDWKKSPPQYNTTAKKSNPTMAPTLSLGRMS